MSTVGRNPYQFVVVGFFFFLQILLSVHTHRKEPVITSVKMIYQLAATSSSQLSIFLFADNATSYLRSSFNHHST